MVDSEEHDRFTHKAAQIAGLWICLHVIQYAPGFALFGFP